MSSKILLPDDPRAVTAITWRQVGPTTEAGKATVAEPRPDFPLQVAQIQRESEQRIREAHAAGTREGEAEADLVKLALAIARRGLRRELAIDPEALHGLVLAALEKLQGQEICRVKVHPSHAAMVTECLRQIVTGAAVEVIPDPSREPGAIVFETERGNLDASVESQLQEIERGLADRLKRPS